MKTVGRLTVPARRPVRSGSGAVRARRRRRISLLLAAALVCGPLAGCSTGTTRHDAAATPARTPVQPTTTASSTSSSTGTRAGTGTSAGDETPTSTSTSVRPTACGPGASAFWLPGPGHSRLEANAVGSGPTAVVFLHEVGREGMCGFWPYGSWLAAHFRVRVVLVNRCGYGVSTCNSAPSGDAGIIAQTKPAVDWARAQGATRVSLVGASGGGSDAVTAATVIPHIAAVVDISGDGTDIGTGDATDAHRLTVPALFAVAPADSYCSLDRIRTLYRHAPADPKRLVVISELPSIHGWSLLMDADGKPLRLATMVSSWVTRAP